MALKSCYIFETYICELFSYFTVTGNPDILVEILPLMMNLLKKKTGEKNCFYFVNKLSGLVLLIFFFNKILKALVLLILLASSFTVKSCFQSSCISTTNC